MRCLTVDLFSPFPYNYNTDNSLGISMTRLLVTILLCISTLTAAAPKTQHTITPSPAMISLLEEARKMMKYEGPVPMPRMYSLNEKDLQALYCEGAPKCDTVTAIYKDGAIYFDEDYDAKHPVWRSILFHEMVHHVQYVRQGGTKTCDVWYKKEREAYDLQASYLRKQGSSDKVVTDAAKNINCPP